MTASAQPDPGDPPARDDAPTPGEAPSPPAGPAPQRPQPRVLVIRGGAIGDFILTIPAIRLLREELPLRPRIEVLGYKPIVDLALEAGLAESTRSMEHRALAAFFVPNAPLDPEWIAYFRSFNVVVSYLFDPDGIFRGNIERCGVSTFIECSHRVDDSTGVPAAAQLARPLERLALFLEDPAPALALPGADRPDPGAPPLVALHPGSGSARKNWGFENWVAVCSAIRADFPDARVLLVSGEAEHGTIGAMEELLRDAGIPFVPLHAAPLDDVGRALSGATLFLGHDSGISHLAAAVGAPCLLLFGPTDPLTWAPRNRRVRVLAAADRRLASLDPRSVARSALEMLPRQNAD